MGKSKAVAKVKPSIFIGSSVEAIHVGQVLSVELQHEFVVKLWSGAFQPSEDAITNLERTISEVNYGVFVFANDDKTKSRGKEYLATRDNTVLELGIAIGRLTRQRSFVLVPNNRGKLKIPSDLSGFGPIGYDDHLFATDERAAITPAATELRLAIKKLQRRDASAALSIAPSPSLAPAPRAMGGDDQISPWIAQATECGLLDSVADLLNMIGVGNAGLSVSVSGEDRFRAWARTLLMMARTTLRSLKPSAPDDCYVVWLKPVSGDLDKLRVFEYDNLPDDYSQYPFAKGEGLAGHVWATGQRAAHCAKVPNTHWKVRDECRNASYICVPVGTAGGAGGVLGFGSNIGFDISPSQEVTLTTFGSVLSMGCQS